MLHGHLPSLAEGLLPGPLGSVPLSVPSVCAAVAGRGGGGYLWVHSREERAVCPQVLLAAVGQRAAASSCPGQRLWHRQALGRQAGLGLRRGRGTSLSRCGGVGRPHGPEPAAAGLPCSLQRCFICYKVGAAITGCETGCWQIFGHLLLLPCTCQRECVRQSSGLAVEGLAAVVLGPVCCHPAPCCQWPPKRGSTRTPQQQPGPSRAERAEGLGFLDSLCVLLSMAVQSAGSLGTCPSMSCACRSLCWEQQPQQPLQTCPEQERTCGICVESVGQ